MFTLLWVVYSMSNHREVRALWQMQRHALVYYYDCPSRSTGQVVKSSRLV